LTLEAETFATETFLAGAAFRTMVFGAALRAFAVDFGLAAFLAAALTGFLARGREGDLAALARFAFGRAVVALATRFAVLAGARFVFERDAGRRTPFARLLLMGLESQKAAHLR
jgi:predicted MFS family arabinose efflux permease